MNSQPPTANAPAPGACEFLDGTPWHHAVCTPLTGDASTRRYFRLRHGGQTAVLMDASRDRDSVAPFMRIARHLRQSGFSAPDIFAHDEPRGLLLLEDFGDDAFGALLDHSADPEPLFALAVDLLIALHQLPHAIPNGLRAYHPEQMLAEIELFLDWRSRPTSETGREEFRAAWREVLPLAHQVPASLLLRDYHVANLMRLPGRDGFRQVGLLDFQDAYQGPITYDLISLLEDARRDISVALRQKMVARYLAQFPRLDRDGFDTSRAIVAALRHTRVLGIFERLSRRDGKHDYKTRHSPRVERLLRDALQHPTLGRVKRWMDRHAR